MLRVARRAIVAAMFSRLQTMRPSVCAQRAERCFCHYLRMRAVHAESVRDVTLFRRAAR